MFQRLPDGVCSLKDVREVLQAFGDEDSRLSVVCPAAQKAFQQGTPSGRPCGPSVAQAEQLLEALAMVCASCTSVQPSKCGVIAPRDCLTAGDTVLFRCVQHPRVDREP
ncbi:hypothetical protein PV326_008653 [Microctonus aethiopoides]|nr:hypothetical protein PV326_008653 [Microctonus aethiopoides]